MATICILSTGVKSQQHLNAYTSFDETVYMFQMPIDRAGLIDKAKQRAGTL